MIARNTVRAYLFYLRFYANSCPVNTTSAAVQQGSLQLPNARNLVLPVIPQAAASSTPMAPPPSTQPVLPTATQAVQLFDPELVARSQGIVRSLIESQSRAVAQSHEINRPVGRSKLKGLDNSSLHMPNAGRFEVKVRYISISL